MSESAPVVPANEAAVAIQDSEVIEKEEVLNSCRKPLTPNVKLIDSLRHTGYENNAAISDIVDNSIDAESDKVYVFIRTRDKQNEVVIVDNGKGMSFNTLHEAMKLGSDTEHEEGDLGKFGMGLITASTSIGRRLIVFTRDIGGKLYKVVMDIDDMIKDKTWDCTMGEPTPEEEKTFNEYVKNATGTMVIIRKCDNITDNNTTQWTNNLAKRLGQTFRKLLANKVTMFIGTDLDKCKKIEAMDPLECDNPKTVIEEDDFDFEFTNSKGQRVKDKVYLKAAFLDQDSYEGPYRIKGEGKPNSRCQGCYLLRNNREIVEHTWFDWWTQHAGLNYIRIEVCFNSVLDEPFNVSFKKDTIDPMQKLCDKLQGIIRGWSKKANEIARARSTKKTQPDIQKNIFDPTENLIKNKANLLTLPKADKQTRTFKGRDMNHKGAKPTGNGSPHSGSEHDKRLSDRCKFETHSFGSGGAMFEPEKRGKTVVIKWNSDHPFYQKYVALASGNEGDLAKAIQLLVFGMATAELTFVDTEDSNDTMVALFENVRSQISTNIKMLLS